MVVAKESMYELSIRNAGTPFLVISFLVYHLLTSSFNVTTGAGRMISNKVVQFALLLIGGEIILPEGKRSTYGC